jgi:hypothetical protein
MVGHHVHKCHWYTNVVKCYDVLIAASSWLHACNMGTSNGVQPCDHKHTIYMMVGRDGCKLTSGRGEL